MIAESDFDTSKANYEIAKASVSIAESNTQGSPRRLGQPWALRGNSFAVFLALCRR